MTVFETLAAAGLAAAFVAILYMVSTRQVVGSWLVAAMLSAGFAGFTAVTVGVDGLLPVWTNHTHNLWGVQVWWDLLFAVGVALFFVLPRARKVGMAIPLWVVFVLATASIGLLAMVARLFWLERAAAAEA